MSWKASALVLRSCSPATRDRMTGWSQDGPLTHTAAVIAIPDERWGQVGMAVVVPARGAVLDAAVLAPFCGEQLARYKVPKRFVVTGSFPRNATGKVIKADLTREFTPER